MTVPPTADPKTIGPKIIGIVQCKNEWGLIGVAISHALTHHVDEVHVIDDGSTDRSAAGFAHLKRLWGDRLHVRHLAVNDFNQEAVASAVIHMVARPETDWIYVFDSDEFLVTGDARPLRALIDGLSPDVGTIVYPIDNFIVADDFDPNLLSRYRDLPFRSVPTVELDFRRNWPAISEGRATFFDVPFLTKVIYRHSDMIRIKAGSHNLLTLRREVPSVRVEGLRGCHLPFTSLERLENKAHMGEGHIRRGRKPSQGWQNQMLYHLREEGRLGWFWRRHSIARDRAAAGDDPAFVEDDRLVAALEPTLTRLAAHFGSDDLRRADGEALESGPGERSLVPLDDVVRLTRDLQNQTDYLIQYAETLRKQLAQR